MGRLSADKIKDLEAELSVIRELPNLKEKSPGTFYFKASPFMHFHEKEDRRWADVKTPDDQWMEIAIEFGAKLQAKKKFLSSVVKAHTAFANSLKK
jgi:hypothetical protein